MFRVFNSFEPDEHDGDTENFLCVSSDGATLVSEFSTHDTSTIRIYLLQYKRPKISKILMKKFTIKDDYFVKGTIKGNLVYLISSKGNIRIYDMKTKESRILGNYMKIIGHGLPQGFTVLDDEKIVAFTENKLFVIGLDRVLNQTVLRYNESPCILGNYFYQKQNTETG
jgi:WD40 repeat protein